MNKKLLIIFFLCSTYVLADNPDCATPTEYIMNFLPKSTTMWRCLLGWQNNIKNTSKKETAYAQTHLKEYCGFAAKYFQLKENGVKAHFITTYNKENDTVEVRSTIQDVEVSHAKDSQEAEQFKQLAQEYNNKSTQQADSCSECTYNPKVVFDKKNNTLYVTLDSSCISKIPYAVFMEKIRPSKKLLERFVQ